MMSCDRERVRFNPYTGYVVTVAFLRMVTSRTNKEVNMQLVALVTKQAKCPLNVSLVVYHLFAHYFLGGKVMIVNLTKLTCKNQQEAPGDDEIRLVVTVDDVLSDDDYQHQMNRYKKKLWNVNEQFTVEDHMSVQIQEMDVLNNDIIGTVYIDHSAYEKNKTDATVTGARAKYKLEWEYLN